MLFVNYKPYDKVSINFHQKETKSVLRKICGIYKQSRFTQHGNMVVLPDTNVLNNKLDDANIKFYNPRLLFDFYHITDS